MNSPTEFLTTLYQKVDDGRRTDGLDLIYNTLDDWLIAEEFDKISLVLKTVDLSKISISMMLSMITVTRPAATLFMSLLDGAPRSGSITGRKEFFERCKKFVAQTETPERVEKLFSGLDPGDDETDVKYIKEIVGLE